MPRIRGGEIRKRSGWSLIPSGRRLLGIVVAAVVLLAAVGAAVALGADTNADDEAPLVAEPTGGTPGPSTAVPTAQQTKKILEEATLEELEQGPETDPQVAEELPHRELDGGEALELAEGVFATQLEEPAGIYDELEPEKFVSDYAAIVPASTLSATTGEAQEAQAEAGEEPAPLPPEQPLFIESTLPLRIKNSKGEDEAVDLSLKSPEGSGGALIPLNPLAELTIPAHLGEGISVGQVGIDVAGARPEAEPTNVEERYAFYPNVAENTDLVVTPTPTGAEAMTQIRSAEAPTTTTYELTLPAGAELKADDTGGAEVVEGQRTTMTIPPPSAIDAAGEPVPVELQVVGESLRVIATPGPEASYPILVDPEFIQEAWYWSSNHESLAAWTSSTTQWSLCPVPYAYWAGPGVPGLGMVARCDANPIPRGTHADWSYVVPRYWSDKTNYGTPPTSTVYQLYTQGVIFLTHSESTKAYPGLGWGITNPSNGAWLAFEYWQGGLGERDLTNWSKGYTSTNTAGNPGAQGADMVFLSEAQAETAQWREAFIGEAIVTVADMSPPVIKKLEEPKKWSDTTAEPISFEVEDSGLGVKSAWASYEGEPETSWGFQLACAGTVASPCPRVAASGESPALAYDPKALPTGKDQVAFAFGDVLFGTGETAYHTAGGLVTLKIDHTPPEVTLSGALTEQEKLGTLKSEYPLVIKAADGTTAEPQSGVAKVEVKVDGKKVTMPNESLWNPGCASENCTFSGTWTLKTSEYTAASHEVEVLVTDGAGVVTSETLEIDLGEAPPQTSFTSPHPSHEAQEIETISFRATRGGAPVEGATFKCSLDGAPATACTSPLALPENLEDKEHIFTVAAVDKSGKADPTPATWRFETSPYPPAPAPANEKLVLPETGKQSASYFTLEAAWGANPEGKAGQGVTGVTFQVNLSVWHPNGKHRSGGKRSVNTLPPAFETVPAECVIDGQGRQVTWPLPVHTHPGHSAPVYLKVRGCPLFEEAEYPEKEIQFRAVFDGSKAVTGASAPTSAEFVSRVNGNRVATDATESIGPGSVDLLTGAFTMTHTDVSIPVPGYEANLEFTRTYSSTFDRSLPGYSYVLGGAWQPGSPLESEGEGQAWARIEKQVVEEHAAVYNDECWNAEEEEVACAAKRCNGNTRCEEWEVEPFQPHEEWIELIDSEGAAVIFEIDGQGNFVAPEYAKELKLTYQGNNLVLANPSGSQTVFEESVKNEWNPAYISFQATPSSLRLDYFKGSGGEMLLYKEIAPNPDPSRCTASQSESEEGCRTLVFHYHHFEIPEHYFSGENKLVEITYSGPRGGSNNSTPVARYEYKLENTTEWAKFWGTGYAQEEMLISEYDPRLPELHEGYAYDETPGYGNLMSGFAPPGQEPWVFEYEHGNWVKGGIKPSRLEAVTRAGARTTIAYGVPTHGSGAPYAMGSEDIAKWGQTDLPVDATAVFPPNHVPSEYPPHEYTGATIHYMDPDGHEVNTASPSPPGVSGALISTTETDMKGNVVRELSPRNRLIALEAGAASASTAHELDTHSVYNANGTEMLESWGPLHQVRLEGSGEVSARQHTTVSYDEEEPARQPGIPPAYLPTKETVAAVVPGKEGEFEPRVTLTRYEWKHRLPEETVVDPGEAPHLNIRTITRYNAVGQVEETRQPKGSGGGTAGDSRTIYYSPGAEDPNGPPCVSSRYVNLPCEVVPVAQAEGTGRKQLPVKRFLTYNDLGEPTKVVEYPQNLPTELRTTFSGYDQAGRLVSTKTTGGGVEVPQTEIQYSPTLGLPVRQRFASCEGECGPAAQFVASIGGAGTGSGQFNHPADVAFDSKGNMWVLDKGNNRIEEFNEKGEFQRAAGSEGSTGGKLKAPSAITVDPSNDVWVADTANNRIEEFNEKGEFVGVVGKDVNKSKVEAKGTEAERNYCGAASGNVCQAGPEGTAPGQLKAPRGIAATSSGNIWVADTGHSRMEKYSPTGTLYNNSFGEGTEPGKLREPTAVAIAPNGSIWVADTGNNRIEYWLATELGKPAGVFGTEGTGIGQFKHPDALEVAGGKIWVGDEGNSRVQEFDELGTSLGTFGSAGAGPGQFSFSSPIGLALDPKGNFWITDPGHNAVQEWTPIDAFDEQATKTTFNALGQVTEYEDADGAKTKTIYDAYGRPVSVTDPKGTETLHYDESSGVLSSMEVTGVGTFTATYDADGNLISRGLPNGLTATTTYNQADEPTGLNYTKTSSCGESCTWYHESLERSIEGRILYDTNTLVNNQYRYDKDGRLVEAQETPTKGQCISREYQYDADSNRLSKVVRPGVSGACVTSGGTPETYTYDNADRLEGPTYDAWGRITALPEQYAGGKALKTSYFANDMVASQTQGTVTNTFQLDATGRQRQRVQAGGVAGIEVFHYDGPEDSPSWTSLGSTWSRNIPGIGGELAAVQESSGGTTATTFKLTDLHGDAVASASSNPAETKLLATSRFTEFGESVSGGSGRFAWLGGKFRRTELSSGVIQMGARSYVPTLGRFLTPDPVPGGSANPYDYADQDPVNLYDLNGDCATKSKCLAAARRVKKQIQRRIRQIRTRINTARERRAEATKQRDTTQGLHLGPVYVPLPTLPWEEKAKAALNGLTSAVTGLFTESCTQKGNDLFAAGTTATASGALLVEGGPASATAGAALIGVGIRAGILGGIFYGLGRLGAC